MNGQASRRTFAMRATGLRCGSNQAENKSGSDSADQ
jgi:hypothetical protein